MAGLGLHGWNLGGVRDKVDFEFVLLREWLPMVQATELIGKCEGSWAGWEEEEAASFIYFNEGRGQLRRKQVFFRSRSLIFKFCTKMLSRQLAQVESESGNWEGQSVVIGTWLKDFLGTIQRYLIFQRLPT